jgi:hypothetical protein
MLDFIREFPLLLIPIGLMAATTIVFALGVTQQ